MADDESGKGGRLGGVELGRRYEQVGPELGRLDEARDVTTGEPVLILRPGKNVKWQLEEGWRVSISSHRNPSFVKVVVHDAPPSGRATKLADVFVVSTAAFKRVEDDARMNAHLKSGRSTKRTPVTDRGPRPWRVWGLTTAGLSLLSLGVGFWLGGISHADSAQFEAARLTEGRVTGADPVTYPMPKIPRPDQAIAPCNARFGEVAINGGCWMTLERRVPCIDENQAEYQGKCYFPVPKRKESRPSQSGEP